MSAIDDKWLQIRWIGNPKDEGAGSQEMTMPDGRGRARDFDNGTIYWTQETGAHEIHGDIRICHARHNWLGYPLTDELGTPDGVGRFNHFEHGSIYWTPSIGAHEVHGAIRDLWASQGWERGPAGYPVSDEFNDPRKAPRAAGRATFSVASSRRIQFRAPDSGQACASTDRAIATAQSPLKREQLQRPDPTSRPFGRLRPAADPRRQEGHEPNS